MIATLIAFTVLVAVWGNSRRADRRHRAKIAEFDHREAKLHLDVDELLYALAAMEATRPYLESEAA